MKIKKDMTIRKAIKIMKMKKMVSIVLAAAVIAATYAPAIHAKGGDESIFMLNADNRSASTSLDGTSDSSTTDDAVDVSQASALSKSPSTYRGYRKISEISEVDSGKKTQVGKYRYWVTDKKNKIILYRQKGKKGKKHVILKHKTKAIKTKIMGEALLSQYAYTAMFTNGKTLYFGLYNRKKSTVTMCRKKIKRKGKIKKIKTYKSEYFSSYSGLGTFDVEGIYKNTAFIYYYYPKKKKNVYKHLMLNLKNGKAKTTKVKFEGAEFDGRYLYTEYKSFVFDCKTRKKTKVNLKNKSEIGYLMGEDGVYLKYDDSQKGKTCVVRMNGGKPIDEVIDLNDQGSIFDNYVQRVKKQYIYYVREKYYNRKTTEMYYRYDRATGINKKISKKAYQKECRTGTIWGGTGTGSDY